MEVRTNSEKSLLIGVGDDWVYEGPCGIGFICEVGYINIIKI